MRHGRVARVLAAVALAGSLYAVASAAPIEQIETVLHTPQGTPPATERIRAGVEVIARHVLAAGNWRGSGGTAIPHTAD